MKQGIHPQYYQAKVTCACGNSFVVGSTLPEIKVEICNKCHPFFTGTQKYIDTAGRVDRFKARVERTELKKLTTKSVKSPSKKADSQEEPKIQAD